MRLSTRRIIGVVIAGLLVAGATTSCSSSQSSAPPTADADGAGVQNADLDSPIVSQELDVPGSPGDTVTVGVLSIEEQGKLQILNLVMTPHFSSVGAHDDVTIHQMIGGESLYLYPTLIDTENLKVYSVVDSYKTDDNTSIRNGEPLYVWAAYAVGEDAVTAYDVRLSESWPMFTQVPVTP
jgi:hypothetical protein